MTMDMPTEQASGDVGEKSDPTKDEIIDFLTSKEDVCFKNQQKWEPDLTRKEKSDIALEMFESSKLNFLLKFGKHLRSDQLDYFQQFIDYSEPEWEEVKVFLEGLHVDSVSYGKTVKNRRFEALKKMVDEDSYFTENEMRKRNPLLYQQLVGQYMSEVEIKERDKYAMDQDSSFVKILMEGIEREDAESFRKIQEEDEDDQMGEEENSSGSEDEDPVPSTSRWGEFEKDKVKISRKKPKVDPITEEERSVLKQEFISSMYQNFLDGKDDFDYSRIDQDASYDNLNEIDHDEEDKYFDSEEPDDGAEKGYVSSEDELDIYMNALTQHPAVQELSKDLKKL